MGTCGKFIKQLWVEMASDREIEKFYAGGLYDPIGFQWCFYGPQDEALQEGIWPNWFDKFRVQSDAGTL